MSRNNLIKYGFWGRLIEDFRVLFSLIKDYSRGAYRDVSLSSILIFVFMIAYILSPVDLLSDFIPVLGQIDDAVVVFLCMQGLRKDLDRYRDWKNKS
jgi:uncharacterized membrane protein YkvA (DUF1232 family)